MLNDTPSKYNYRKGEDLMEASKSIDYNPLTGEISHAKRANSNGSLDKNGYLVIKIKGVQWKAHRLAWAKYHGKPPVHNIDHIDRDNTNNKISNLRDVPQRINVSNTKRDPNPDTGVVGIYKDKVTKGLRAVFTVRNGGKSYRFRTLEEAIKFKTGETNGKSI